MNGHYCGVDNQFWGHGCPRNAVMQGISYPVRTAFLGHTCLQDVNLEPSVSKKLRSSIFNIETASE